MHHSQKSETNKLLGYPADARLLIINADDFGMCHATNAAIFRSITEGVVCSTTLMVPCPWALHAMHLLVAHPEIPFGVHLTVLSDGAEYRWGPLTPRDKVPSLLDETGYFYRFDRMPEFLAQIRLDEVNWNSERRSKPCWQPSSSQPIWIGMLYASPCGLTSST